MTTHTVPQKKNRVGVATVQTTQNILRILFKQSNVRNSTASIVSLERVDYKPLISIENKKKNFKLIFST